MGWAMIGHNLWKAGITATAFLISGCGGGGSAQVPNPPPPPPPTPTYTITSTAEPSGQIAPQGTRSVAQGGSQTYTATPSSGYYAGWIVDGITTAISGNTYTFNNLQQNHTIRATFTTITPPPTYTVSGAVTGGVQSGVVATTSPGGASAVTAANGSYTISGLANGSYTVTPSHTINPTFSPASRVVTVSGANVTGVNFTTPVPVRTTGKLLYPCKVDADYSFCSQDLSTNTTTKLWGGYQCTPATCDLVYPDTIVPYRSQKSVAVIGGNIGGILGLSLPGYAQTGWIDGSGTLAPDCFSWPADHPNVGYDISPQGDFAVIASSCSRTVLKKDIFLVLMDGSNYWARVTDDVDADSQPVIGGVDTTTGYVTVLFVRNGTEIRKQVADPANDLLVGSQTVIANNVMTGVRSMSVNAAYTHLAFMKNVGGVSHITVVPLAGGAEVDLGVGTDPYWALDGSNVILYTADSALWVINQDGTGKMSVPTPSSLPYGLGKVVFGPPGF